MMRTSIRQPKYAPVGEPKNYIYWSKQDLKNIMREYEVIVRRFLDDGWDGYIATVDFNKLRGAEEAQVVQMRQAMEKLYIALSESLVGTSRPKDKLAGYLPIGIFFPHLSRSKYRQAEKAGMRIGSATDELHIRGIVIANRWQRIRTLLDKHFAKNKDHYLRGEIRDIHVERFDQHGDADCRAVRYVLDGLLKRTFIPDDILILNWGSELKPSAWPDLDSCSGSDVP